MHTISLNFYFSHNIIGKLYLQLPVETSYNLSTLNFIYILIVNCILNFLLNKAKILLIYFSVFLVRVGIWSLIHENSMNFSKRVFIQK